MSIALLQEVRSLVSKALEIAANPTQAEFQSDWFKTQADVFWFFLTMSMLSASNKRLRSIALLLSPESSDVPSAQSLMRITFENAADLEYISREVQRRIWEFFERGRYPIDLEDREKTLALLRSGELAPLPKSGRKNLSEICSTIEWEKPYRTFYTPASDASHGGPYSQMLNLAELLGLPPIEDRKTLVLLEASSFHLHIASVVAREFPSILNQEYLSSVKALSERLWEDYCQLASTSSN